MDNRTIITLIQDELIRRGFDTTQNKTDGDYISAAAQEFLDDAELEITDSDRRLLLALQALV